MKMMVLIPLLLTFLASIMPVKRVGADGTDGNSYLDPCKVGQQTVAFSVGLSRHVSLKANESLKYNRIFTNVGGGYNTQTGVFTCPTAGLYVFQFHALSSYNKEVWLELRQNHQYIATCWGKHEKGYTTASNSVILRVAKDDEVFIVTHKPTGLYGSDTQVYATFSGYLLSPIQD